jgi:hypothetical protein
MILREDHRMAWKLIIIGILIALCACQSAEDRYWSDVGAIVDRTQPKK